MVGSLPPVNVRVTGPESVIEDLVLSDITPVLDLGEIDAAGSYSAGIDVQAPSGVWRSSTTPATLAVLIEPTVAKQIPISVVVTSNLDSTQQIGTITPAESQVVVRGPQSAVESVATVELPVDAGNQTQDFTGRFVPVAKDASGNVVSGVEITPDVIPASVQITARGKRVAIITTIEGDPAQGYVIVDRTINPSTALVDGPAEVIASMITISTEPVDITNAQETVARRVKLVGLPDGVRLLDPSDGMVDVVVQVRQQGQRQPLPSQAVRVIGLGAGLAATVSPESVAVVVVASDQTISALTATDIVIQVNVAGLPAGTYQLRPMVSVPPNVTWITTDPEFVTVTITNGNPPATPPPSSTPITTP